MSEPSKLPRGTWREVTQLARHLGAGFWGRVLGVLAASSGVSCLGLVLMGWRFAPDLAYLLALRSVQTLSWVAGVVALGAVGRSRGVPSAVPYNPREGSEPDPILDPLALTVVIFRRGCLSMIAVMATVLILSADLDQAVERGWGLLGCLGYSVFLAVALGLTGSVSVKLSPYHPRWAFLGLVMVPYLLGYVFEDLVTIPDAIAWTFERAVMRGEP